MQQPKIEVPMERPPEAPVMSDHQEDLLNNVDPDWRRATKVPVAKVRDRRNRRNKIVKLSRRKNRKLK